MDSKIIAHIDMDAFFAAIEQRDNPEIRNKPVIIGADPKRGKGRGVVSTCSYEARHYGIHSAMPISVAYKRCPHAVFLPIDALKYKRTSKKIFEILYAFTPDIEPVSIDEAFFDITSTYRFYKTPINICMEIKKRIKQYLRLSASVGIASNKMVAKIASDFCKPDGLLEIKREDLLNFLQPLPVEKLWGVGPKTQKILNEMRVKTVKDLSRISREFLFRRFGEHGWHLFSLAHGIDLRELQVLNEVKSISHEYTFDRDTSDKVQINRTIMRLSEKVSHRLRKTDLKGKTVSLKIRFQGFKTCTKAHTFIQKTNFTDVIYKKAKELFDGLYKSGMKIRLIGIKMSNFSNPYVQESLFIDNSNHRKESVYKAIDVIKNNFGEKAIRRAV